VAKVVRMVALQFMVSEKFLRATPEILQGVREMEPEPKDVRIERKVRDWTNQAENMTIDPIERVAVNALVYNLLAEGYVPVDSKRQKWLGPRVPVRLHQEGVCDSVRGPRGEECEASRGAPSPL